MIGRPAALDGRGFTLVAVDRNEVVGFASAGAARDPLGFDGEPYAIYLQPDRKGSGLGRRLFEAAVAQLALRGFRSMYAWVLAQNPARSFYARLGGEPGFEKEIAIGGARLREIACGWRSLPTFVA